MPTFALKTIEQVRGKQVFEKLVVDGQIPFDTFVNEVEKQFESELDGIFNWMNRVANNNAVPREKFHPLKGSKDSCREYEFKSKHLRVYLIEQSNGKIVVMGGTKTNQPKDIQQFRKIKQQYLKYLTNNNENESRTIKK